MTVCELKSNLILKMKTVIIYPPPCSSKPVAYDFLSFVKYVDVTLLPLTLLLGTFSNHAKLRVCLVLFMSAPVLLSLKNRDLIMKCNVNYSVFTQIVMLIITNKNMNMQVHSAMISD